MIWNLASAKPTVWWHLDRANPILQEGDGLTHRTYDFFVSPYGLCRAQHDLIFHDLEIQELLNFFWF
jgi:hypothetical protein